MVEVLLSHQRKSLVNRGAKQATRNTPSETTTSNQEHVTFLLLLTVPSNLHFLRA